MNNKDKLKNNLDSYINNKNDKFAFLVNGHWGSGKTYLINEYKEKSDKKDSIVYVSLNGAVDLEKAFKQAIVGEATVENIKEITKSSIKSIIKNKLGVDLDDISFPSVSITTVYKACNKKIVFIDDIERCKCEIDEIFGVIDELLRNDFKVILIMNSESFENDDKEKYKEIQEKIINRKITIKPDDDTFNNILEETALLGKVRFYIFKDIVEKEHSNWFNGLNATFDGENVNDVKIEKKTNLRLFTRTINNSLDIINVLENKNLIQDNNRRLIYTEIINGVYLYLHEETFPDEIDTDKYNKYGQAHSKKNFGLLRNENADDKAQIDKNYKYCEKVIKTSYWQLKNSITDLTCVQDWFLKNEMEDIENYKKEFESITKEKQNKNAIKEIKFNFQNIFEEDVDNYINTIIQKVNNNTYDATLIFEIIENILLASLCTENQYLEQYKSDLINFIKRNVEIVKRDDDFCPDDHIEMYFKDYGPDNINIVKDLMHTLDERNAEITFEDFKKNLKAFKMPNYEDYEGLLTIEFLNKVIALQHEEIIKKAISSKKYYEYIHTIEGLFYKYITRNRQPEALEKIKKYVEEILDKILPDDSIDKYARIQFKWFKKRIEEYLF